MNEICSTFEHSFNSNSRDFRSLLDPDFVPCDRSS